MINRLRTKFLLNCKKSDIVPKFLRFRIPQNGCFNEKSVHDFQMKLLHQEITQSKGNQKDLEKKVEETRNSLKNQIEVLNREYLFHSVIWHTGKSKQKAKDNQEKVHNKKLKELAEQQDRPLFNVKNTVKILVKK